MVHISLLCAYKSSVQLLRLAAGFVLTSSARLPVYPTYSLPISVNAHMVKNAGVKYCTRSPL